jgi:hypothetical protein
MQGRPESPAFRAAILAQSCSIENWLNPPSFYLILCSSRRGIRPGLSNYIHTAHIDAKNLARHDAPSTWVL